MEQIRTLSALLEYAKKIGKEQGPKTVSVAMAEDAGLIYCLDDKDQFIGRAECPELTGTPRQELAARCTATQQKGLRQEAHAARREAKAVLTADAVDTLLAAGARWDYAGQGGASAADLDRDRAIGWSAWWRKNRLTQQVDSCQPQGGRRRM